MVKVRINFLRIVVSNREAETAYVREMEIAVGYESLKFNYATIGSRERERIANERDKRRRRSDTRDLFRGYRDELSTFLAENCDLRNFPRRVPHSWVITTMWKAERCFRT